jgi:excisionase family DNA binding protein
VSEALLLGVREAARSIGLGRDSAYELIRTGRLRVVRVGRRILVPRSECAAFIEREIARNGHGLTEEGGDTDLIEPFPRKSRGPAIERPGPEF